ncbi:MAG TPA: serine/threonine-protein kinase [Jatrophihabitans sp.]|nr:serine/threonine-protein kinase [Jatrophihabitans sp.]
MALPARNRRTSDELGARFDDVRPLHTGERFSVYRVRETATRRPAVVKVPKRDGGTWLSEVLDREAAVLAAIGAHPNIVTLYQRFELDDGRPALLLEHCPRSVVDDLRDGGRLALQETVALGVKLAGALETVHKAGFVHCDVRPANVLVTRSGEPVLSGFDECVRATDPPGALHVTTPHTAPELLEGRQATPRTDVYGLAATLYELVAGQAAFRAYAGESPATVAVRVLSGRAKPIVSPDIPLDVSDLLTWALAPEPAARPPGPTWLAEELGRIERRQGWPRTALVTR